MCALERQAIRLTTSQHKQLCASADSKYACTPFRHSKPTPLSLGDLQKLASCRLRNSCMKHLTQKHGAPVLMAMRTLRPLKRTCPPGPLPSKSPMLTVRAIWCSASLMGHCSSSSRCCTCRQYRTCTTHANPNLQHSHCLSTDMKPSTHANAALSIVCAPCADNKPFKMWGPCWRNKSQPRWHAPALHAQPKFLLTHHVGSRSCCCSKFRLICTRHSLTFHIELSSVVEFCSAASCSDALQNSTECKR